MNVVSNVNVVLEKLFSKIGNDVFEALDKIFVINENIIYEEPLSKIIRVDGINYISIIANAFIVLYTIYFIITNFLSMYNGEKMENPYKFIIRVIIVVILSNSAIYLCKIILEINFALTTSIDEIGTKVLNLKLDFCTLKDRIVNIEEYMKEDTLSLSGVIKGMLSFGSVSVLLTFAVRYVVIILLVILSPLAIMCLSSKLTSGIFSTYIRVFLTNIFIQNIVKFIIMIPLACEKQSNLIYKVIMVGSIYLIYKINMIVKEMFSKITSQYFGRRE